MDQRMLERIAMQAWPCLKEEEFDGWTMRFAEGYTKRANSVHLLGQSTLPLPVKITHCEEVYTGWKLPVIFKVPDGTEWSTLDQLLEKRGYAKIDESSVQVLDLNEFSPSLRHDLHIELVEATQWLPVFYRFQHGPTDPNRIFERMIRRTHESTHFVLMKSNQQVIACAMIVGQSKTNHPYRQVANQTVFGLFDLVVRSDLRGIGYGRWLMNGLLDWCRQHGGSKVYLQVLKRNEPARRLYDAFGFVEEYRYWYRTKDLTEKGDDVATVV